MIKALFSLILIFTISGCANIARGLSAAGSGIGNNTPIQQLDNSNEHKQYQNGTVYSNNTGEELGRVQNGQFYDSNGNNTARIQ